MRLLGLLFLLITAAAHAKDLKQDALKLSDVLESVTNRYPPYLMALIERDIAAGRLRQAQGAFDVGFLARGSFNPTGYYDGSSADFVFDQPLPFWGGNVFAGYRVSSGALADYDKTRTQRDGEFRAGLRLNLLRDGPIDRRRADLWKARLDQEMADPFIQRQYLDVVRTASRAYYNWVAMGLRLHVTRDLLRVATERDSAIAEMVAKGLAAPIVQVDNQRLVVSRELALIQAQRRVDAAAIELSLFLRDQNDDPRMPQPWQMPSSFPALGETPPEAGGAVVSGAFRLRPELRRIDLLRTRTGIDHRLARNSLLPNLDVTASTGQNIGGGPYKDRAENETNIGVEFRIPLQRNEAKGRVQVVEAELERLARDAQFARERIVAEIRDAASAMNAASQQVERARRNVELSRELEAGEQKRLTQGAADLLALQIREQATFEAALFEIDARADYFRAAVDYEAATAARLLPWRKSQDK
jgi:outer membrane protein TolC